MATHPLTKENLARHNASTTYETPMMEFVRRSVGQKHMEMSFEDAYYRNSPRAKEGKHCEAPQHPAIEGYADKGLSVVCKPETLHVTPLKRWAIQQYTQDPFPVLAKLHMETVGMQAGDVPAAGGYLTAMDHAGPYSYSMSVFEGDLGVQPATLPSNGRNHSAARTSRGGMGSAKAKCSGFLKKSWTF